MSRKMSGSDFRKVNVQSLNCLVVLVSDINLRDVQNTYPDINILLQLKKDKFPKPPLFAWKDTRNL